MDEYTLISMINKYQNGIFNLQELINQKRERIQDLEEFYFKFSNMSNEFDDEINRRSRHITNVNIRSEECTTLKSYQSMMSTVLNGNKKSLICQNFVHGKQAIADQIDFLENQIVSLEQRIDNCENTISDLKIKLNSLREG